MDDKNNFENENTENSHYSSYSNGTYQNNSGKSYTPPNYSYNNTSYGTNNYQPNQQDQSSPKKDEYEWDFKDYQNSAYSGDGVKQKKRNKGLLVFGIIVAATLIIGSVSLISITAYNAFIKDNGSPNENTAELEVEPGGIVLNSKPKESNPTISPDGKLTTEQIADKVKPSVVGIVNYQQSNGLLTSSANEGSGIIMSKDGYIITNAHVVSGASGLKVVLSNGEEYSAVLKGIDVDTDLAVIKIDANDLTYAEFGNSTEINVGEKAVAIGNPGGLLLQGSVTQGIISAVNRPILTQSGYQMNVLQTDAAINPGNSGGALINQYGQIIGINSSKISATDYEGIGFAIPISDAQPIIDDLIRYGYVKGRVRMGVTVTSVDEFMSSIYSVPVGILINSVEAGSGASEAGLVPGDIITELDGKPVTGTTNIKSILSSFQPGQKISAKIFRQAPNGLNGKYFEVTIKLMEAYPQTQNVPIP